ncbi:hypothetical protein BBJ28_00008862 [Nothophytophthora sp. Chile5]|nr:hypothetical protein BBJ28_00008862 [Nothophytophthora sp. Chile5]
MTTSSLVRTLRVACPLGASFCILATLVTCVVIVKVNHIWTIVSYKLYKTLKASLADLEGGSSPRADKLHKRKKTLVIQIIFFACFFVAFVTYMPVGTALAPQSVRLSIDDCIDEELGETYCTTTMRLNDTDTTLYDDRTC